MALAEPAEIGFVVFTCAPTRIVFVDEEVLREVPTCLVRVGMLHHTAMFTANQASLLSDAMSACLRLRSNDRPVG